MHQLILQPRQWPSVLILLFPLFEVGFFFFFFIIETEFSSALFLRCGKFINPGPRIREKKIIKQQYLNFSECQGLENLLGQGLLGPIPRISDSGCGIVRNIFDLFPLVPGTELLQPLEFFEQQEWLVRKEPLLSAPVVYVSWVMRWSRWG